MLKLGVLLKHISKSSTSYWFNTCLVVRSNEAEPAARAEQLQSRRARTRALQVVLGAGGAALALLGGSQEKPGVKCIYCILCSLQLEMN